MKIEVNGVHFSYGRKAVLNEVNIAVEKGKVISIVGPNGSGKSTILKCIDKILKPQRGTILLEGKDIGSLQQKELAKYLGYVPQSGNSPFPSTVFDTVLMGRRPHTNWSVSSRDKEIVSRILRGMGLEDMALRYFNELSGGERQKVLLARAMAQEPEVLLLDEPTSALDLRHQLEVMNLISSMVRKNGISVVMAIHDLNLASRYSDWIILLKNGQIYAAGDPASVLHAKNIREVYGVDTIINQDLGKTHIIPVAPC
ncbi:MAG: ABC transporter ATP-binding protein [Firmicutes bacterium]|jgi:iron complex transport system ATP-binding protein|nr:ABC transporter ATP-binding protein [Bacillota bacterium]